MPESPGNHPGAVVHRLDDVSGSAGQTRSAGPLTAMAGFVLVLVGVLALREVASLIVQVVAGLLIALVAWPLVGTLERRGVGHAVALAGTIVVVLAVIVLAACMVALAMGQLAAQIPRYESRLSAALSEVRVVIAQLPIEVDPGAITAIISPEQVFAFVRPVVSSVSEAVGALIVLVFTVIYALAGGASFEARATAAFDNEGAVLRGLARFGKDLRRYLVVRARLGLFAGVLSFALLLVLGVPFAVLWAMLVFAASFVPNVGSVVAVVPPMILAYLDSGPGTAAMVVVGYTLINLVQDQLLQPIAMGSELNLSPLAVFVAVIVWAWILGPAGALLAVPLTVGLVELLEAFPSSRGSASLLRQEVAPSPGTTS